MLGYDEPGQVHVIPENDEEEHIHDYWCWCEPRFEEHDDRVLVIHQAADMRHLLASAGCEDEPNKRWLVYDER